MAKKATAKPAAKRKPRAKKPVQPAIEQIELPDFVKEELNKIYEKRKALKSDSIESSSLWRRSILVAATAAGLVFSFGGGVWSAGGINIGPKPIVRNDVLQQSYDADRASQAKILREYAAQGFKNDDDGRQAATKWFNDNRFRHRGDDFRPYTSAVTDNFAAGTLAKFADELEGKR